MSSPRDTGTRPLPLPGAPQSLPLVPLGEPRPLPSSIFEGPPKRNAYFPKASRTSPGGPWGGSGCSFGRPGAPRRLWGPPTGVPRLPPLVSNQHKINIKSAQGPPKDPPRAHQPPKTPQMVENYTKSIENLQKISPNSPKNTPQRKNNIYK